MELAGHRSPVTADAYTDVLIESICNPVLMNSQVKFELSEVKCWYLMPKCRVVTFAIGVTCLRKLSAR
jgi:hypothetical protein